LRPTRAMHNPNFAYFVYDGVPEWKGAIDPDARDPKLRPGCDVSQRGLAARARLPNSSAANRPSKGRPGWDPDEFGTQRNAYKYTGTLVYEGVVYDHIGLRARGGGWRHAMGKNMWKFNFLPGIVLPRVDFYGRPYNTQMG